MLTWVCEAALVLRRYQRAVHAGLLLHREALTSPHDCDSDDGPDRGSLRAQPRLAPRHAICVGEARVALVDADLDVEPVFFEALLGGLVDEGM